MEQQKANNEHGDSSHDSDSSSIIEADADEKKHAPRRRARSTDPDHKKSFRRSWRSASPLTQLTLIFVGISAAATALYMGLTGWSLRELRSGGEETRKIAQAARDSADAAQKQADIVAGQTQALKDAAQAAKDSASAAQTLTGQNKDLIAAARTQAETSRQLVEQNRLAVGAAISQSKAAQASVGISQQTFTLLERPSLGIEGIEEPKIEIGKRAFTRVAIRNYGHIPARNLTVMASLFANPVTDINLPCPEPGKVTDIIGLTSRTILSINGVRFAHPVSKGVVEREDITRIKDDKSHWIYVHIRAEYGERSEYFLEYYGRYNVETKSWEECGTYNRAN
jgi:hypothetical protein